MPDFVAPQLCRLVDEPPIGAVWVHEIKFDGYRMQLRVEKSRAVLRTRKALDWTHRFPEIARDGRAFPDCMIDGEICALDDKGVPSFAGLQQALSDGRTGELIYFAFDLLFLEGEDFRQLPLEERKSRLAELIAARDVPRFRYVEHFATSGKTFLETACRAHLEGIISKRSDAPYRAGRGDLWTKEKCRGGQEVVIGGWWGGPGKLRSILVGSFDGEDFVYRGRIGTGFNSENSGPVLRALNRIKQAKSPFTAGVKPPRAREITWVTPKLVAEVEYATVTRDGLLRQASFKALREDKPAWRIRDGGLEIRVQPGKAGTVRNALVRDVAERGARCRRLDERWTHRRAARRRPHSCAQASDADPPLTRIAASGIDIPGISFSRRRSSRRSSMSSNGGRVMYWKDMSTFPPVLIPNG